MTVEQYIAKAIALIDDTDNIADYSTNYFIHATNVVCECINLNIGCSTEQYLVTIDGDTTYAYTPADGKAITMPSDLTADEQIVAVDLYSTHRQYTLDTATVDGVFYLIIPEDYYGDIMVRYKPASPDFTALTDIVPLTSGAVNAVAVYGLAALLAVANDPGKANFYEQKYEAAKKAWRRRGTEHITQVVDVYPMTGY